MNMETVGQAGFETPDEFVRRAAEFAEKAHEGQKRKYTGDPYITHPMSVAFLVSRVTQDPKAVAAAWLHDVVEDTVGQPNMVTFDKIAQEFGFIVAGMVRTLSDMQTPEDGNRATRKAKYAQQVAEGDELTQTVKVADMMDNTVSIVMHDWVFTRTYLKEKEEMLDLLTKAEPNLVVLARDQLKKAWFYLDNVIGDAPLDAPRLSTGHPSTLGAYLMLATTHFGPESEAVKHMTKLVAESKVGEVVLQDEGQMIYMLTSIHQGVPAGEQVQ